MVTIEQITDLMRAKLSAARGADAALTETTTFEDLGVTSLELANFVYQKARDLGLGVEVSL